MIVTGEFGGCALLSRVRRMCLLPRVLAFRAGYSRVRRVLPTTGGFGGCAYSEGSADVPTTEVWCACGLLPRVRRVLPTTEVVVDEALPGLLAYYRGGGGEQRRTEWWRGTCGLARWLPGVDCGVVVIRWPLFLARHERRRLGVGCELVGFARDELHGAGGSRRLSRRVVREAGEAMIGVAGAAANKRIARLFVAELSSPSGRVALAQAFGDFQLPSGVDGDGPFALEYVNSVRDEPGVQSTGGRMLDEVGCVKVRIEVTQRGVRRRLVRLGTERVQTCCCRLLPGADHRRSRVARVAAR